MSPAAKLINEEIQKRTTDQSNMDIARILIKKYPEHFGKCVFQSLQRRVCYQATNLNLQSKSREYHKQQYTNYGLQIIKDFPNETIMFYAYKFAFHFNKSLVFSRQIISQLRKFKKIL